MIQVRDKVWIGNSADEEHTNLTSAGIGAVLNVAQDMVTTHSWYHDIEVMHVGLVDGPGNIPAVYAAAVLGLHILLQRHSVLVCCHDGGRSLAVVIMYASATGGGRGWPGDWVAGWDNWLYQLGSNVDQPLPEVNPIHKEAFDKMNWNCLIKLME